MKLKRLFVLTLICTLWIQSTTIAKEVSFSDVSEQEWYYDNLYTLINNNIIDGFPDGTFRGEQQLYLDQFIKTVAVIHKHKIGNTPHYWAKDYIQKALDLNWLNDTYSTTIEQVYYERPISRYETAEIIVRSMSEVDFPSNYEAYSVYINDFESIPEEYNEYVLKAYALGLIRGYPDETFKGDNYLTRAEATAIQLRMFDPFKREKPLDPAILELQAELFSDSTITSYFNDEDGVKFENNQLYYQNESEEWLSVEETNIMPSLQSTAEEIVTQLLDYTSTHSLEGQVFAGYGYGTYGIGFIDAEDFSPFIVRFEDNSSSILLTLNSLHKGEQVEIDTDYIALLNIIITNLCRQYTQNVVDTILIDYENQFTDMNYEKTTELNSYKIKTVKNDFGIDIVIDMIY